MDNRIKDAFDGIHAEESLKQSTKAFLVDKSRSKSKPARVSYRSPITAFACAVLIFIGMSGCILFFTPVTAIAMDVNPSVELSVNRFEIVVSVSGLNEDGKALAKNSDAKYKNYLAAVDALMESEEMQECLADDATVSVTVIGNNEKKNEEMMNKISSCKYSKNFECTCASREDA